ncbi:hypothetical protein COV20_03055 [Candidatus Woesearchaeota archaeon CG10_big_fil_rev_8_21_14_0_10_45_16]|nr:MAG: hypothetical protein COV20_03055 [Candidatus Woesearchaeota archaeon CG10_big_fil_rev_8_21_14_0_10_45_16]
MKKILFASAIFLLIFITACSQSVADIKNEDMVGQSVKVSGTVENTLKIGSISGYTLVDQHGDKIAVSSGSLPKEGEKITVKGTLIKDTIFGYYIKGD